jgi:hypothetical protein
MITNLVLVDSLNDLRHIAKGGVTQAQAFANLRADLPTLFPEHPTMAEIKAVTDTDDWKEFDTTARRIFADAFFNAPREIDGEMVDITQYNISLWEADKKTAKTFSEAESKIRKAAQAYVRVAFRQNVTKLIPEAIDAPMDEKAETLPDPTGVLALVTEALIVLSEKSPDGALALLNGLDTLVKVARPHVAARQPIPRKA